MKEGSCTHFVLHVQDMEATRNFYVLSLGCIERRYAKEEGFLSIGLGDFIINFYKFKHSAPPNYTKGISHIGLEYSTRAHVDAFYKKLKSTGRLIEDHVQLSDSAMSGPYRFYVSDPDGYVVEIHSWEGVEEEV